MLSTKFSTGYNASTGQFTSNGFGSNKDNDQIPSGYVSPYNGDATNIATTLIRSKYSDWEKNYQPIELETLQQSSLNNPNVLSEAVGDATERATGTVNNLAGVEERQLAGLGIKPTEQQAAVSSRVRNLSRAGIMAGAQNTARAGVAATDEMIALGGIPSVTG